MSKKYKFIFCGIAFALAAIIVGLCFVFFGNKTIKSLPETLEVQKVEGEYFLVTEFNPEYHYQSIDKPLYSPMYFLRLL